MLITNYIKSAWRNILRHKLFSIINILGLAIGLAAVMLIALYVRYETNYDSFWKNADNIYRLHTSTYQPGIAPLNWASMTPLAKEPFDKDFPQVAYSSRYLSQQATISHEDKHVQEMIFMADPDITNIFNFGLINGNVDDALSDTNNIIITRSMAEKIFGDLNPIDEIVTLELISFTRDYKIAAVVEDIPKNSMFDANIIITFVDNDWKDTWVFSSGWTSFGSPLYFSLKENANISDVEQNLPAFIDRNYDAFEHLENLETSDVIHLNLLNIQDVHLKSGAEFEIGTNGDQRNLTIFTIISFLIIFIAATNYMNLSTSRASKRAKEVSLRKTVGATRKNIIQQFLGESILLTLFAMFIAIGLVEGLLPIFNNWLGTEINLNYFSIEILGMLILAILVGILGGIYPSFILSSFRPATTLKTNQSSETKSTIKLRYALVILQFSISIILFASTAVVYQQINFVMNEDTGFEKENLLILDAFRFGTDNSKAELVMNEIKRLPNVISAATSSFMIAPVSEEVRSMWNVKEEGAEGIRINSSYVGYDYFKTINVNMVAGRDYDVTRDYNMMTYKDIANGGPNTVSLVVNEAALKQFNLGTPEEAIGKRLYQPWNWDDVKIYREFEIIGVIPDVKLENFKKEVRAEIFFLDTNRTEVFTIRYTGDPRKTVDDVGSIWKTHLPKNELVFEHADKRIFNEYLSEQNQMTMFAAFSGLAIFIACLGLFGLASFTAERRTKEIGIRKVFGAEVWQIVRMLVFQFSKPVLIANIIAWPIAYLAMSRWLESFVYRIDDMVIIALCLIAGLTALLIAWATVAGNSYAVARQNPIKALRYE